MKRYIIFLLLIFVFSSGFMFKRGFKTCILFNKSEITKENVLDNQDTFEKGQKIHYLFLSKKPIKVKFIRVQILKPNEKAPAYAMNIVYANDFRVLQDVVYYYTDYFVLHSGGRYFMQIFDKSDLTKPIARAQFFVK